MYNYSINNFKYIFTRMTHILIQQLNSAKDLNLPSYATKMSAGLDLMAAIFEDVVIQPGEFTRIATGIKIALPEGFEAQIRPRSGLSAKFGITVLNSPGTIDADYRGEIQVILINHGKEDFIVERGMRIAQMIVAKFERIDWAVGNVDVESSERKDGGFGSTGLK